MFYVSFRNSISNDPCKCSSFSFLTPRFTTPAVLTAHSGSKELIILEVSSNDVQRADHQIISANTISIFLILIPQATHMAPKIYDEPLRPCHYLISTRTIKLLRIHKITFVR